MKIFDEKDIDRKRRWEYMGSGRSPENDGIKPLIETNEKIEISTVIIVNNTAYVVCSLSGTSKDGTLIPTYGIAEKTERQDVFVENEEPEEQNFKDNITCPYCGYENQDSWECTDDEDEEICGNCGSTFSYERIVTVEYTSYPVKKADCVRLR